MFAFGEKRTSQFHRVMSGFDFNPSLSQSACELGFDAASTISFASSERATLQSAIRLANCFEDRRLLVNNKLLISLENLYYPLRNLGWPSNFAL